MIYEDYNRLQIERIKSSPGRPTLNVVIKSPRAPQISPYPFRDKVTNKYWLHDLSLIIEPYMVISVSSSSYGWAQIYLYKIESYQKLMHLHLKNSRYYHLRITFDLIHEVISKCGFLQYFKSLFEYSWVLVTSLCYVYLYRHQPILHDSLYSLLTSMIKQLFQVNNQYERLWRFEYFRCTKVLCLSL